MPLARQGSFIVALSPLAKTQREAFAAMLQSLSERHPPREMEIEATSAAVRTSVSLFEPNQAQDSLGAGTVCGAPA